MTCYCGYVVLLRYKMKYILAKLISNTGKMLSLQQLQAQAWLIVVRLNVWLQWEISQAKIFHH